MAIDYEVKVSEKEMDRESSVMIEAFLMVSESLLEIGIEKAAFYFASLGIQYCEYSKELHPIGEFLLTLAKITRKQFRYRQSILMLKKALEYNWWKDGRRSDELNSKFIQWLAVNSSDEVDIYVEKF